MKISHRQLNVHHGFSIRGEALCFLVLFAFPLDLAPCIPRLYPLHSIYHLSFLVQFFTETPRRHMHRI